MHVVYITHLIKIIYMPLRIGKHASISLQCRFFLIRYSLLAHALNTVYFHIPFIYMYSVHCTYQENCPATSTVLFLWKYKH